MSNTPSDAEIEKLAAEHLKAFAQFTGAGDVWVEGEVAFARAVLAKWGTQPQAGAVPLTDEQIEALPLWKRFVGLWPETRREIVRTIEHHHGIKGGQHVGKVD